MEQEPATLAKQIGTEGTNETLKFTMFQWLAGTLLEFTVECDEISNS